MPDQNLILLRTLNRVHSRLFRILHTNSSLHVLHSPKPPINKGNLHQIAKALYLLSSQKKKKKKKPFNP
ncbi:hypothetical protein M5K25_001403 [Dendrobium thyrsiflorum]|uniref:Uncharacterized protein n=1 Tax=Dendrobium thyrsiflorum TaxID=117978 RepID=A0ABD0VQE7_DENTH